ncbi:MAG: lysophospholipid acyltransferase family protein [Gemmatimonadaceae bacterium]
MIAPPRTHAPAAALDRPHEVSRPAVPPREIVLRHRVQYAALRGVIAALGGLGFRRASALGARLGRLGHTPLGIRRGVVETQIAAAFPDWDRARVVATARAAYESLGRTSVEVAILSRYGPRLVLGLFDPCETWHVVENALAQGRGVILAAGHHGNWELGGAYLAARGVHLEAVVRMQENPLFDAYLTRTRQRLGLGVIYDADAVRRIPRVLRDNAMVALMMDQGAAGMASTWVPFFGRFAKTPRGPATFALRLQSPIIFMTPLRKPDGRYTISFEDVPVRATGDKNADVDRIAADYTAVLERWVRVAPEQYFWHHRRWKHQRPDTPPELGNPL